MNGDTITDEMRSARRLLANLFSSARPTLRGGGLYEASG